MFKSISMKNFQKIDNIIPVILCGGSGTRLWPLSRKDYPKQFNRLLGENSLFQETILRLDKIFAQKPVIITGEKMKFLAAHELSEINLNATILTEPEGRNSGPAVLLAAFHAKKHNPNAQVAIFASDHVIDNLSEFHKAVLAGQELASMDKIVTFGIKPTEPSNAYGYIQTGKKLTENLGFSVERFVEKPNVETAKDYIQKGFLWNSGNFIFKADVLIEEYKKSDKDTVKIVKQALEDAKDDLGMVVANKSYASSNSLSIDYAVMEKTDKAAVVEAHFSWSDAGTWKSLYELSDKDEDGNAIRGDNVFLRNMKNSYIHNESGKLICGTNLDDISVIATEDAVLVAPTDNADDIKDMLSYLSEHNRPEVTTPKRVYRPWGWYETIALSDRYQVKRINVYKDCALSLQKHFHRAEHWVVVTGTAEVTNGDKVLLLTENQSTYIPVGAVHRLKNVGKINLELIEVQSGGYLGEDDIVRLEDIYNRA